MTQEWTAPAWLVVTALAVLVLAVLVGFLALRARARRLLADTALLERRLSEVEHRLAGPAASRREEPADYVITRIGDDAAAPDPDLTPVVPVVPPAVFADIVLRESVVKSASLVHGLRRALAPEVRNRIRFEVRREVKRARKARRVEQREALREWQSRQRAEGAA